jgi:hypothetical protein
MISITHVQKSILFILIFILCVSTIFSANVILDDTVFYENGDGSTFNESLFSGGGSATFNHTGILRQSFKLNGDNAFPIFAFRPYDVLGDGVNFTYSFWFNSSGTTVYPFSTFGNYGLYMDTRFGNMRVYDGDGNRRINTAYVPQTNTWTHIALRSQNGVLTAYVNGSTIASASAGSTWFDAVSGYLALGRDPFNSYWTGYMDEFRIYDTALSDTDIQTLWGNGTPYDPLYVAPVEPPVNDTITITFPDNITISVYNDPYDAFNWTTVMQGNGVCPLNSGSTDRFFYMFIIVIAFILFVFAFWVDNSLFGLLASILLFYIGMLSFRCDTFLSGILILIAMIGMYLSFTQLSLTNA